jgi:histidine ammonia-lyase
VAHYDRDRLLAPDIEAARALLLQGAISRTLPGALAALWDD